MNDGTYEAESAARHLWMPFKPPFTAASQLPARMVGGEGSYLIDDQGNRYLDSFASICSMALGHGRDDLVEAGLKQSRDLGYASAWTFRNQPAEQMARFVADRAPDGLSRVFFTSGGSEAVESAIKMARQYFRLRGKPSKTKMIAREVAYHGTTMGALSVTGLTPIRTPYEPLLAGVRHVPNTNVYRLPKGLDPSWYAEEIRRRILFEGPETVAAVFLEPVQNAGGCIPPPDGYFDRVREICDEFDVLLVSDEVICAWGRLGDWFGCGRLGYRPDMITAAKGLSGGYAPLGALVVSDSVAEPFVDKEAAFMHGYTFSAHPVVCAIGLAASKAIDGEGVLDNVRRNESRLADLLASFRDIPIVGDTRGVGYFQAIEFVRDQDSRTGFPAAEALALTRRITDLCFERGMIARSDVRGEPVLQVALPLIAGPAEIDEVGNVLRPVLEEASAEFAGRAG
ncbi:aspartate aminotransferase family protein [Actinomadura sp. KC06]|uniref:aspartate aminotransferase family protein n=1 Tax=Actinomadura sp. KC06 TaxID=2530369 RepID=UPI001050B154|nr:aspartate aminotransferase family protein [Actinomadura sp. KC06]TDD34240.1 aspartate aminotransferase family protein [Actinomadura sp. KC06]